MSVYGPVDARGCVGERGKMLVGLNHDCGRVESPGSLPAILYRAPAALCWISDFSGLTNPGHVWSPSNPNTNTKRKKKVCSEYEFKMKFPTMG